MATTKKSARKSRPIPKKPAPQPAPPAPKNTPKDTFSARVIAALAVFFIASLVIILAYAKASSA